MGASIGILAGIWGAVSGTQAPRGKHRKLVLNSGIGLMVVGALCLIVAILALCTHQPYHVWYPFLLVGVLLSTMLPLLYRSVKKTYTNAELRKMSIDDMR